MENLMDKEIMDEIARLNTISSVSRLFDKYMGVGEIRPLLESETACVIDLWTGDSLFLKDHVREESAHIKRRSLKKIRQELLDIAAGRKIILLIESDDDDCGLGDPMRCSDALNLLIESIASDLAAVILYTPRTCEEIVERSKIETRRIGEEVRKLLKYVDVVVVQQANRYADPMHRVVLDGKTILDAQNV